MTVLTPRLLTRASSRVSCVVFQRRPASRLALDVSSIAALRVEADEAAAVVEIDGALRVDGFGARHLADAVEQQPLTVAQAVGVGAADQQVDAGGQVQPLSSASS